MTDLTDRPITDEKQDKLGATQVAQRIFKFVNTTEHPLAIAITGQQGSGKTSVINLLKKQIEIEKDKNAIVLSFEPLLEGNLELVDIIKLFYKLLFIQCKDNQDIADISKKALLTLATLIPDFKFKTHSFEAEVKPEEVIDNIFEIWKKEAPSFIEQAQELNNILKTKETTIYCFLDEIDRLPAALALNILLFARTLESFEHIVCIIGIDYEILLKKLQTEGALGLCDYHNSQSYLEKLFQLYIPIHPNKQRVYVLALEFIKEKIPDLPIARLLEKQHQTFQNIVDCLSTPRNVKKWVIMITLYTPVINRVKNIMDILGLLAAFTLHPGLFENYVRRVIVEDNLQIQLNYAKHRIQDNITAEEQQANILLAKLGIEDDTSKKDSGAKMLYDKHPNKIVFRDTEEKLLPLVRNFLEQTSWHLILQLAPAYFDEESLSLTEEFLKNPNKFLQRALKRDNVIDSAASDLANTLRKSPSSELEELPDIEKLNQLWQEHNDISANVYSAPYYEIILFCLRQFTTLEQLIKKADLSLSLQLAHDYLERFNINNEYGVYNLDHFKIPDIETGVLIKSQQDIQDKILTPWLRAVSDALSNTQPKWYDQAKLLDVFYRFIQLSKALDKDEKKFLSDKLIAFFESTDTKIALTDKKKIAELITHECENYLKFGIRPETIGILSSLFGDYQENIITTLEELNKKTPINKMDSLRKLYNKYLELSKKVPDTCEDPASI